MEYACFKMKNKATFVALLYQVCTKQKNDARGENSPLLLSRNQIGVSSEKFARLSGLTINVFIRCALTHRYYNKENFF